jgi:hypothetical protein
VPEFATRVFAVDPTVPGGLTIAASVAPGEESGSTIVVNAGAACFWLHGSMELLTLPPLVNDRLRPRRTAAELRRHGDRVGERVFAPHAHLAEALAALATTLVGRDAVELV